MHPLPDFCTNIEVYISTANGCLIALDRCCSEFDDLGYHKNSRSMQNAVAPFARMLHAACLVLTPFAINQSFFEAYQLFHRLQYSNVTSLIYASLLFDWSFDRVKLCQ